MSVTMLMFRDTPWDGWDADKDLEDVAGYIPLFVGETFTGTVIHTDIDIFDRVKQSSDLVDQHGYMLIMNDKVIHSDDLYVMFWGAKSGDDPFVIETLRTLQGITGGTAKDGSLWTTGVTVRFEGGAPFLRNQFALGHRSEMRVVK